MHTNRDVMLHTEHEVWEGDESLVAVFTASCLHAVHCSARFPEDSLFMCTTITLRMAKLPYSSVLYPGSYLTLV